MSTAEAIEVPDGGLTFLFTDVEGSTRLWEDEPEAMRVALQSHDEILRRAIETASGHVFSTAGDAFAAAFETPAHAVAAATEAQRALDGETWPDGARIRVRMGVHTGAAHQRDDNYYGPTLNRAARLMSAAHGGQTVLSSATLPLVDDVAVRDLGEHRLKDLSEPERVWQLIVDGLTTDFPPLRTLNAAPTNLPVATSTFIGREADIDTAMAALENNRLVTLTGVGGVGKTRLALQVAADASHHYPDGLWFLELAPVRVGDAVPYRILDTLGLSSEPGHPPLQTVAGSIGEGTVLMVVDNCEHLARPAAAAIAELLSLCPSLRVLATSRRSLGLPGEQLVPIRPLDVAGASSASTQLFLDRAEAATGGLDFADRLDVVSDICRRVDGVPLAIELAAARTRSMTPEDMVDRLDERFRLLRAPRSATGDERHRTLQATIEWSYDLLDNEQRVLFERLAVFAGRFTLEAVEAVCADDVLDELDIIDLVSDLVDHSLLVSDTTGVRARFRMLDTIREYAGHQLGDRLGPLQDLHAAWHVTWAERVGAEMMTSREARAVEEVDAGWSDLRTAVAHAAADPDVLARILAPLTFGAQARARIEFADWATGALALTGSGDEGGAAETRAVFLACVTTMLSVTGDHEAAIEAGSELATLGEDHGTQIPLNLWPPAVSGMVITAAIETAGRLHSLFKQAAAGSAEPWAPPLVAVWGAAIATYAGNTDLARASAAAAVHLTPPDFSPTLRAVIHWMVGRNSDGPPAEVIPQLEEGIDLATGARSTLLVTTLNQLLSQVRAGTGDLRGPMGETIDNLQVVLDTNALGQAPHLVAGAALMMLTAGMEADAVTLLGWLQTQEAMRNQLPDVAEEDRDRAAPFMAKGASMSREEIVRFAIDTLRKAADEIG